jgi:medium-chain acyl-[acyl-carrier-protein] hydrolase
MPRSATGLDGIPMDATAHGDRWLERKRSGKGEPLIRVVCFPYAAGTARTYRHWAEKLGHHIEICAVQLPGRERRLSEPAIRRYDEAVDILVSVLRPLLDLPVVLFGHSMGAILAYEVARGLLTREAAEPLALLVSGRRAPHMPSRRRRLHDLPRDELLAEIKALNGTPAEVFEHQDIIDLILPALRADLELVETYAQAPGPVLSCPVMAMSGDNDGQVNREELAAWRLVTTGPFKPLLFAGDHFYLNDARSGFLDAMRRELALLATS